MSTYKRHRFHLSIISYAVWVYYRFNLSFSDIEDLLAEKGISVSYESIRLWRIKFGPAYARKLKQRHGGFGDTFYLNEVFIKINGKQHYLWRVVDQDGEVVDVYVQSRRNGAAARQFFKRLLHSHGGQPRTIVTDKLASYRVAKRELMQTVHLNTAKYANNRAEQSHESTRFRERDMRRFKSPGQAQLFLTNHAAVSNLFNLGGHLTTAGHYRRSRTAAFATWRAVVA